jgi:hypothetical protein
MGYSNHTPKRSFTPGKWSNAATLLPKPKASAKADKPKASKPKASKPKVEYRTVNGKKFKVTVVPMDYKPSKNTIGVKCGEIRLSNGKVDPTLVPGTHR